MRALKRNARKKAKRLARFRAEFRERRGPCGCPNCILVAGVEAAMGSLEDLQVKITHDQVEVKPRPSLLTMFFTVLGSIKAGTEMGDGLVFMGSESTESEDAEVRASVFTPLRLRERATEDAEVVDG